MDQIAQAAHAAGFRGEALAIATAIAMGESRGQADVRGDNNNPKRGCGSYGLWQVNSCPHRDSPGPPRYVDNPTRLFDPLTNARAAFIISESGRNWRPWTVYKTGAYRLYLGPARRSAERAGAGAGTGSSAGELPPLDLDDPSAVSTTDAPAAGGIFGAVTTFTSPATWRRVAYYVGGGIALIAAVALIVGDTTVDTLDRVT